MKIQLTDFQGMVPRTEPRILQDNQAQVATNVDLTAGTLRPFRQPSAVQTVASGTKTIFPYRSSWLTWTEYVDVVQGAIINDLYDRIFYTGDGTPKVRGLVAAVPTEYTLGVPAPATAPVCNDVAKASVTWTRSWRYQYEEPDGTISEGGALTEGAYGGTTVYESTPGKVYQMETMPAKTVASNDARFVLLFDAYDAASTALGRLYPAFSAYASNKDFVLNGAIATGTQVNDTSATPNVVLTITYDTSRASDYAVSRTYVYTYVTLWDEEGPPSPVSNEVDVDPTENCTITGLPAAAPAGYANITAVNIYRTVVSDAGTAYQYVAQVAIGTASYSDTQADSELASTLLTSTDYDAPPTDLSGLVQMPGEFLAGFSGKTVWFTAVGKPHAWPFGVAVDHDIVAIGVTMGTLVVTTIGPTYCMTGATPDAMSVVMGTLPQPCTNKESMVNVGTMLLYSCPDGIVGYQGAEGVMVSEAFYTDNQWSELSPTSMIASVYDGRYYAWHSTGAIFFNPSLTRSGLVTTDQAATALYSDLETDTLYFVSGTTLYAWEGSTENMTMVWRGKINQFSRPGSPNVARINAESYDDSVTMRLYADGTLVATINFTNDQARKIPTLRSEKTWEIEVEASVDIYEVTVASAMSEI